MGTLRREKQRGKPQKRRAEKKEKKKRVKEMRMSREGGRGEKRGTGVE